jgi:hypothetical protein
MALLFCHAIEPETKRRSRKGKAMGKTIDEDNVPPEDAVWTPHDEDPDMPEMGAVLVDADERTPEEAGYGHGV